MSRIISYGAKAYFAGADPTTNVGNKICFAQGWLLMGYDSKLDRLEGLSPAIAQREHKG